MVVTGTVAAAGAVVATCSGALIAGAGVLTGWRQRVFQKKENSLNRAFSAQQQQLQHQLQIALQDRNFKESERIQRAMSDVQYANALALQDESFKKQEALWKLNKLYENVWPLRDLPENCVADLKKCYTHTTVPLQILVPNTLSDSLQGLGRVLKSHYSMKSNSPVFYNDGGWKDALTIRGNALLNTLYKAFRGLPTLVLMPSGSMRDSFSLDLGYWGLLNEDEMMSGPESKNIISAYSMDDLELEILRSYADELINLYAGDRLKDDDNMKARRAELARIRELRENGLSDRKVQTIIRHEFGSKYTKRVSGLDVDNRKKDVIRLVCDIVSSTYSDVYFLNEYGIAPQAPLIAQKDPMFSDESVRSMLKSVYQDALDALNDSSPYSLRYPLCCALVADSMHRAGWEEDARQFYVQAHNELKRLYGIKTNAVAEQHVEAARILLRNRAVAPDDSTLVFVSNSSSDIGSKSGISITNVPVETQSGYVDHGMIVDL